MQPLQVEGVVAKHGICGSYTVVIVFGVRSNGRGRDVGKGRDERQQGGGMKGGRRTYVSKT